MNYFFRMYLRSNAPPTKGAAAKTRANANPPAILTEDGLFDAAGAGAAGSTRALTLEMSARSAQSKGAAPKRSRSFMTGIVPDSAA
mgnify:CR=1 FL=1